MTTCKLCPNPVPRRRVAYCSEACRIAGKAARGRERYHADAAFAEQQKARARDWVDAHREQRKASQKAYAMRKAFAAVLLRVDAGRGG